MGIGGDVRRSEAAAQEVLESLIARKQLGGVLRILQGVATHAHGIAPTRWGIRVNPRNVMLKVGMIEVLQVAQDALHLVVVGKTVPRWAQPRLSGGAANGGDSYKFGPGSRYLDLDWPEVLSAYPQLKQSHLRMVEIAAESPRHPTTRRTHSPGAVAYIAKQTRAHIPQPSYHVMGAAAIALNVDEVQNDQEYPEGAVVQVLVDRYERDPDAREACLRHFGYGCAGCGKSMAQRYGPSAAKLVHVHHLSPLSGAKGPRKTNAKRDLRPLCPNCHAVAHSARPPLSIAALEEIVRKFGG